MDKGLRYKSAILKETLSEKKETVKKGWVYLDISNNVGEAGEAGNAGINEEEKYHEKASLEIEKMSKNWEEYKKNYIEVNGEDAYYHNHGIHDFSQDDYLIDAE